MHYRRFGRTGLSMPLFSCGGMRYQESWNAQDKVTEANQRRLEQTIQSALTLGIRHIETARGYGTSESQLGRILPRLDRDSFWIQTKVCPTEDPREFEANLEESFDRLGLETIDLFAIHGINNRTLRDWTMRPHGCLEVAKRFRDRGRLRFIGFSTHGETELILSTLGSGEFDYVNIHWYYILQDHLPVLEEAHRLDVGVFIISPSDKGGRLYDPPSHLVEMCAPYHPIVFNDLFCFSRPEIHTLSIGASRDEDFSRHLEALERLEDRETLDRVVGRLEDARKQALGSEWAVNWDRGLPSWKETPDQVNVRFLLWLSNLSDAYGLRDFGRYRYGSLGRIDHWLPGQRLDVRGPVSKQRLLESDWKECLAQSPHRDSLPDRLIEAHHKLKEPFESEG